MSYAEFLGSKLLRHTDSGFTIDQAEINSLLFEWQRVVVRWALHKGKSALFESCGLGKTPQQLAWADEVYKHTGGNVLIKAPLAVASQTIKEGKKFGIAVNYCRGQAEVKPGINITNYEMMDHFDENTFVGSVADESSILKAFSGKTKNRIIQKWLNTPYKLCCTATPSPNDHLELLNHAEHLNVMPSNEALARWFINDTMNFGSYRLKKHAIKDFWRWVSTWAVCINTPSDIGYDDNGFVLPPLKTQKIIVRLEKHDYSNGALFREYELKDLNATTLYKELRETAPQRCAKAIELANDVKDYWVLWCNTNDEAARLTAAIPDAVNVHGGLPWQTKESLLSKFSDGAIRVMVSKPSLAGFGLNWQHVSNMAFVGISYSFEQRYQAIRRCWRFGQKRTVNDYVILSPAEEKAFFTVARKERQHHEMQQNMVANIGEYSELKQERLNLRNVERTIAINIPQWMVKA